MWQEGTLAYSSSRSFCHFSSSFCSPCWQYWNSNHTSQPTSFSRSHLKVWPAYFPNTMTSWPFHSSPPDLLAAASAVLGSNHVGSTTVLGAYATDFAASVHCSLASPCRYKMMLGYWCCFWWLTSNDLELKLFLQTSQSKVFLATAWIFRCLVKLDFSLKVLSHTLHRCLSFSMFQLVQ